MALALFDRVQETTTTIGSGSITLDGAVSGFQSFAVVGNTNTCYYTIIDGNRWEVGVGTYSTTGPTLDRTTILSNSDGNTSPITLTSGSKPVFLTYPAEKAVYVNQSSNVVLPGGLQLPGSIEVGGVVRGGSYGGNQFYPTTGSGAQVNSLREGFVTINVGTTGAIDKTSTFDVNGNLLTNSVTQSLAIVTAAAGITTLTPASPHFQILVGTGVQTFKLPDATTLAKGSSWVFDNDSTGNLTVTDNAGATVDIVAPGGYSTAFLEADGTVGGTWGKYGMLPSEVNWGTNSLDLGGSTAITNGVWNGTTIAPAYGGTGLTTFAGANNALYSTGASTLTAGTLPVVAGGTGLTSFTTNGVVYASGTNTLTSGSALSFDGNNLLVGTTITPTGTGKISAATGYTAPDNAAGAGTTLNILGSTGTGIAGPTGGNGVVQIIGGGGTSPWTSFSGGIGGRRRGGILLQAGLAAGDAGATYFSGSAINILGSNSTNNGTTTGLGSQILITAGSAVAPTGTNAGSSLNLSSAISTQAGFVGLTAGNATATSANGGSATISAGSSATGFGGSLYLNGGTSSGNVGGGVNIQAGNSTGVAGANVSITSGTGTANGKIGFTIGALGEVAQLDSSGNLGLGVTPSAWGSVYRAVQNRSSTFYDAGNYGWAGFLFNAYHDNTNARYISGNRAGEYRFDVIGGTHSWYTAPSGTAGDAITFTQAMTLDASGNLMIAATTPIYSAANRGNLTIGGSSGSLLFLGTAGTTGTYISHTQSTATTEIWNGANGPMLFATNNTERARIDSSGNLSMAATGAIVGSRINPRTATATSTATLSPDIQAYDQYNLTAQNVGLTVAAPIGVPVDGNKLIFRILDNGTSQAITWNAAYVAIGTTLPTATVVNKMTYVGCIYNSTNTRWDVIAVTTQA